MLAYRGSFKIQSIEVKQLDRSFRRYAYEVLRASSVLISVGHRVLMDFELRQL